ncbi:hypothetical protein [Bradyrhizobium sp. 1]|uniref:hypothetical protein n=1 Tax=Bradyrhizobium sp. 1 TaxID=241591 RepID=UPI001FF80F46|nr:hypothetical protein [Bradyrhizobium sp. 1]MCK1392651.1 hypothetical protein [Bradyrhizobium sp. 1]
MGRMSDELRDKARRAERLSSTIGSLEDARKLRELSRQFDAEADALDFSTKEKAG